DLHPTATAYRDPADHSRYVHHQGTACRIARKLPRYAQTDSFDLPRIHLPDGTDVSPRQQQRVRALLVLVMACASGGFWLFVYKERVGLVADRRACTEHVAAHR